MSSDLFKGEFNLDAILKPVTILAILLSCIAFIGVRYQLLDSHFTHVDDIIAPAYVFHTPEDPSDFSDRLQKYFKERGHDDLPESASKLLELSYPIIRPFVVGFLVSSGTTNAPGQFLLTSLLVNHDHDYKEALYWARIPSFLCAVLSLIVLLMLYRKFFRNDELPYVLVGISLISFSWMHIIYSFYTGPYAVGILAILLTFLLFFKILSKSTISKTESLILGISLSSLMFINYQFIFFIPAFYIGLLHSKKWNLTKFFKSYLISVAIVAISFVALFIIFLSKFRNRGTGWDSSYVFNPPSEGIFETFRYCIEFFLKNIYLVFKSLVGFANFEWMIVSLFAFVCILLFLTGILSLARSRIPKERSFGVFLLSALGLWFFLVILGYLSLSPARHSLVYQTIILIYVPIGLKYFVTKILNNNTYSKYIICFALVSTIIIPFSINYSDTYSARKDKFDEKEILNLYETHDLTHIFTYGNTHNLLLMKFNRENFTRTYIPNEEPKDFNYVNKHSLKPITVLFISNQARLDDKIIERFYKINNISTMKNFQLIEKKEIKSETEWSYSNLIPTGLEGKRVTNSLYYYIYRIPGS